MKDILSDGKGEASQECASLLIEAERENGTNTLVWRVTALCILALTLVLQRGAEHDPAHLNVLLAYGAGFLLAMALAVSGLFQPWLNWAFTIVDALLVVYLMASHALAPRMPVAEALAIPSLAIAFVLLSQASLQLRPAPVALYGFIVVAGWIGVALYLSVPGQEPGQLGSIASELPRVLAFMAAVAIQIFIVLRMRHLLTAALAAGRERANLARFFAPQLAETLAKTSHEIGLKRQTVAILFVDIRGFTGMSEQMSAEQVAALLTEYRSHVTETVAAWDGVVDKFVGDGVMAVFGLLDARTTDAQAAVSCALDLADRLENWSELLARHGFRTMTFGIGVHYDEVIGGILSTGQHDEHTIIGDAVNVADRLQRLTKSLEARVVISEATASRIVNKRLLLGWRKYHSVELVGRAGQIGVRVLPRGVEVPSTTQLGPAPASNG